VRLGGAKPEPYNALALHAVAGMTEADAAGMITANSADLVLLSAERDSAWFAAVAAQSQLSLSGPGHTGPASLAFLTRLELLGDTALVLPVQSGGTLHVQDALYKVDKERSLDMMLVSFADVTAVREGVRALLGYIATDVGGTAALVLGIDADDQAVGDSAAVLIRAAFDNALDCGDNPPAAPVGGLAMRLFYGPEARMTCTNAHVIAGNPNAIVARVVVER
jgi:hypothetical protein